MDQLALHPRHIGDGLAHLPCLIVADQRGQLLLTAVGAWVSGAGTVGAAVDVVRASALRGRPDGDVPP